MEIPGELLTIICGAIGVAFTGTTTAIYKLWMKQSAAETRLMRKLDECEKKHDECERENARIWKHLAERGIQIENPKPT